MLTPEEIKKIDPAELHKELQKARHELVKVKMKLIDQSSKEIHKLREIKRYIAQIQTFQNSTK